MLSTTIFLGDLCGRFIGQILPTTEYLILPLPSTPETVGAEFFLFFVNLFFQNYCYWCLSCTLCFSAIRPKPVCDVRHPCWTPTSTVYLECRKIIIYCRVSHVEKVKGSAGRTSSPRDDWAGGCSLSRSPGFPLFEVFSESL